MKLLILEDNPGDARLIMIILKEAGLGRFEVSHVTRLADALQRLEQEKFDAVLSDLGLPDSQGLETVIKIKQQAPSVPIVVLTGNDDEAMGVSAVQQGAQDFLNKGKIGQDLLMKSLYFSIERKRGEQSILEERNRAAFYKDLLVHDINNLNHGLLFHLKRLLTDQEVPEKPKGVISTCCSLVEKIAALITNVHLLSELDNGKISLDPVDFITVFNSCAIKVTEMFSQSKKVDIRPVFQEKSVIVKGNYLLDTIITNILINAVKYNTQPIAIVDVVQSLSDDDHNFKIEFKDNGIGIQDGDKGKIFNKIERDGSDSSLGLGIGLTLVKKVVEGYGGKIWIEDRIKGDYSQGSSFVLLLPKGD